jgi:hypothetical protein
MQNLKEEKIFLSFSLKEGNAYRYAFLKTADPGLPHMQIKATTKRKKETRFNDHFVNF